MCGRFTREYTAKELQDVLDVLLPSSQGRLPASYNVAPTQQSFIARLNAEGQRELETARWGLIPFWADDESIGNRMINARAESVSGKPAYRAAFRKRRCLVPVSAFYEWQKLPNQRGKQPWYIHATDAPIMCFAGLWERWEKGDEPVESFTIITTDANDQLRAIHDRMPVALARSDFDAWLDPEAKPDDLADLLRPAPVAALAMHPVSPRVNSPKNDDPSLIEPVEPAGGR